MERKAGKKTKRKARRGRSPGEPQTNVVPPPSTHPFVRKTSAMKADEDAAAREVAATMKYVPPPQIYLSNNNLTTGKVN